MSKTAYTVDWYVEPHNKQTNLRISVNIREETLTTLLQKLQ